MENLDKVRVWFGTVWTDRLSGVFASVYDCQSLDIFPSPSCSSGNAATRTARPRGISLQALSGASEVFRGQGATLRQMAGRPTVSGSVTEDASNPATNKDEGCDSACGIADSAGAGFVLRHLQPPEFVLPGPNETPGADTQPGLPVSYQSFPNRLHGLGDGEEEADRSRCWCWGDGGGVG